MPAPTATFQPRRLILCFDGTWNKPEDQTNVWRFYSALPDLYSGCPNQIKYYDPGVGTEMMNRVAGGAFGIGLDRNVLEGYAWLINNFQWDPSGAVKDLAGRPFVAGDEIWLVGFSRGAYTARSLGGLLGRCGLLRKELFQKTDAKGRTFIESITADHQLLQDAWDLYRRPGAELYVPDSDGVPNAALRAYRERNARMVSIKFVGVWDTVGALGIPKTLKLSFANRQYKFHDTNLGFGVEHAYHALAIDENRKDYEAALWTRWRSHQHVEQRWFPGAHSNVGGGYEDDLLFAMPLAWMAEKACNAGLTFLVDAHGLAVPGLPPDFRLRGDEFLAPVRDSFRDFLMGIYRVFVRRWFRPMLVEGAKEIVDECARRKWSADGSYRPKNLAMAGRADVNPASGAFDRASEQLSPGGAS
jgi:uncharacterized protein (DUF2235 family)